MPAVTLKTHQDAAQALQAAGVTLDDPDSRNVLVGRCGAIYVQARLARRGWAIENAARYPSRSAICRTPEQVSAFCASLAGAA